MSESVPSSVTGFAHRRPRVDSVASFTYFQEDDESPDWSEDQAVVDGEEEDTEFVKQPREEIEDDLESGVISSQRRKSSGFSRSTAEEPLLHRHDSTKTDASGFRRGARFSQKIYVVSEDLTIVVAGFTTTSLGLMLYLTLCTLSLGLAYLILRWLPRWRVHLLGSPKPLEECDWVAIEVRQRSQHRKPRTAAKTNQNQWGEFIVQEIVPIQYGYVASTVFGLRERKSLFLKFDDDDDPIMTHLRFLNYRYISFCFHPLKDKFVLCSDWKDPKWIDVKSIRAGLDSDERHRREQVFGTNQIDIQQKSILQLLVDEVNDHPKNSCNSLMSFRPFILSMFSKLRAYFSGLLMNTIIMQCAFSLFQ